MQITILNKDLVPIDILESYESFIWTDRYREYGDFELYTPIVDNILDRIKQDYYLINSESEHVMIVEKLRIESDTEFGKRLTVTGRSLESILTRRIIWGVRTIQGNFQNAIETLLNENIISPTNADRKIPNFIFESSDDPLITELTIDAQYIGNDLYDIIHKACTERNIGFKIILNDSNQFVFKLYAGVNRSYDQIKNPYVIFSPGFDNMINSNYIESKSVFKNVTLIMGESEGSSNVYADIGNASGLDRREIFTDARSVSSDIDGVKLNSAEYIGLLCEKGRETLSEHIEIESFEGGVETSIMFKYGEDFFNGDIIQIANEYGHESKSRIVEIVISENEEGYFVYPTFETVQEGE